MRFLILFNNLYHNLQFYPLAFAQPSCPSLSTVSLGEWREKLAQQIICWGKFYSKHLRQPPCFHRVARKIDGPGQTGFWWCIIWSWRRVVWRWFPWGREETRRNVRIDCWGCGLSNFGIGRWVRVACGNWNKKRRLINCVFEVIWNIMKSFYH